MHIKAVSRDGDYGIFVREADDGENLDFYFCSRTGKVIGPEEGFPRAVQVRARSVETTWDLEPRLFLADVPQPTVQ